MVRACVRALTVVFDDEFLQMARCLQRSIEENSPSVTLQIRPDYPPKETKWIPKFVTDNLKKLEIWAEWVELQAHGELCALLDADVLVLRDISEAFMREFDLLYTVRPGRVPFNCGVIFFRAGHRVSTFFRRWLKHNRRLVKNQGLSLDQLRVFAGGNQWAFNETLEDAAKGKLKICIETAPCSIWNCEQETWREFGPETAILHVKSWLRTHLLNHVPFENDEQRETMKPILKTCRSYGW